MTKSKTLRPSKAKEVRKEDNTQYYCVTLRNVKFFSQNKRLRTLFAVLTILQCHHTDSFFYHVTIEDMAKYLKCCKAKARKVLDMFMSEGDFVDYRPVAKTLKIHSLNDKKKKFRIDEKTGRRVLYKSDMIALRIKRDDVKKMSLKDMEKFLLKLAIECNIEVRYHRSQAFGQNQKQTMYQKPDGEVVRGVSISQGIIAKRLGVSRSCICGIIKDINGIHFEKTASFVSYEGIYTDEGLANFHAKWGNRKPIIGRHGKMYVALPCLYRTINSWFGERMYHKIYNYHTDNEGKKKDYLERKISGE